MWADGYIAKLVLKGETVQFRPRGNSMQGRIESGQLCTVEPVCREPIVGDIVLCRVAGSQYLHLVTGVKTKKQRNGGISVKYRISNNKGHDNGWISISAIYGICTSVTD